ncbi:MAG: DUF5686 and carboxypeptidase regulatory-like domain-containing protein [Sphingobacteriaceae bacterium]
MKFYLILFFSLFTAAAWGQNVALNGKITDAKGEPIPFASIYIKNTTQGTSANQDGEYRLSLKPGKYEFIIRAVGYQQSNQWIELVAGRQLNISLNEESYQLKDVVIRADAEDPAYEIIRQAIKKRRSHLNEVKAYEAEVYIKGMQKLLAAPKKFMGVDVDEMARRMGLDSNRRGIIYLSESESKLSYQNPGQYHEEMVSSKVSGSNRSFSFNRASDLQVNFYENFESWEGLSMRPLISPIADNALFYYHYKFLGNAIENGQMLNKIQVIPKRTTDPVFQGSIYILEDSWRIHSLDLLVTKTANLNFVDTLKIKQEFFPVQRNAWMPSSLKFEFAGGFLGFRFAGYYIALFKNYDLSPAFAKNNFREALRITQGVNKKDSIYWKESRPIPLTEEERSDYEKKEVLAAKRQSKSYLDSLDRISNQFKLSKILLRDYTIRNRYERKSYQFNSLLKSVFYNTVEGFGLDLGAAYLHRIDTANNRVFSVNGSLRYGFSNQHFNAHAGSSIPVGKYTLNLRLGTEVLDLNDKQGIPGLVNTFNSLFYERNRLKLYEKQSLYTAISGRIGPNIQTSLSLEYANRKNLVNTSSYTFRDVKDREFTSNNPYTPDTETPLFPENQSFKISLRASYNFSSRYVTYPSGKYYLPSKFPALGIRYTKALKGFLSSDVDHDLLSLDLAQSEIPMGFYGKFSFNLSAGKFLNKQTIYYPDYQHFGRVQTLNVQNNASFLMLDYYLSSTPEKYFEAHAEHNFSGFILNKVPLIRKLKLQELFGLNYLATPLNPNYREWLVGLKFLNMKVIYGWSYAKGALQNQGLRFTAAF